MRPGGSKAKGSAFERVICKDLSLWLSRGERDDLLWRSAMSGGRASAQFKRGRRNLTQTGDISAIDPLGSLLTSKILIECKAYRDLVMIGLYLDLKGGINGHWTDLVAKARQHKKMPMLVAKQNLVRAFVCLDQPGVAFFKLQGHVLAYFPRRGVYLLWLDDLILFAHQPE